jgi:hypothetical protein
VRFGNEKIFARFSLFSKRRVDEQNFSLPRGGVIRESILVFNASAPRAAARGAFIIETKMRK